MQECRSLCQGLRHFGSTVTTGHKLLLTAAVPAAVGSIRSSKNGETAEKSKQKKKLPKNKTAEKTRQQEKENNKKRNHKKRTETRAS
ncbi:MAG: hypothetical protein IKI23_12585 [Lachnospiraceae bacterium]|nr:hypothetical protein [Lachnospiraceae bacterium]